MSDEADRAVSGPPLPRKLTHLGSPVFEGEGSRMARVSRWFRQFVTQPFQKFTGNLSFEGVSLLTKSRLTGLVIVRRTRRTCRPATATAFSSWWQMLIRKSVELELLDQL